MTKQTRLKELKKSLANLPESYSLTDLTNIFDGYQLLLATPCAELDPLYSEWKSLNTIYQQYIDWQNHNLQNMDFCVHEHKHKLKSAKKNVRNISTLTPDLQTEYEQLKQTIEPELLDLLNEFIATQTKQDKSQAQFINHDLKDQLGTIEEYRGLIETEINHISLEIARLALYTNDKQRKETVSLLQQLNIIIPSSCGLEELPALMTQVNEQLQITQKNESSLEEFHKQFAQQFSGKNAMLEIETLSCAKQKIDEDLQKLTTQISQIKLDDSAIRKVAAQFKDAPDKKILLEELQTKLTKHTSYINPYAWRTWLATHKDEFKREIAAQTLELQLTQLLATQDALNNKILDIDQQLAKQKSILDSINQLTSQTQTRIPVEIADLLSLSAVKLNTTSDLDLFNILTTQIKSINIQIAGIKNALGLLNKLTDIESAAFAIRQQVFSKLKVDCSTLITDSEAMILNKSQREQQLKLEELKIKLLSCKNYERSLKDLAERINHTQTESAPPNIKSKKKHDKQRVDEDTARANKINNLQASITTSITELKKTYVPEKKPENADKNQYPQLWNQIIQWDKKINTFSQNMSPELKAWYEKLFMVLKNEAKEEKTLLQSIQLLRDIHFELSYADTGVLSQVLGEYYFQHASPSTSYMDLLELKPALAIDKSPEDLPALTDKTMQKKMKKLYDHQQSLAPQFPKEAALLKQATINFHQMALNRENKKKLPESFSPTFYTNDPRYKCLEKHRGFGKAWEWLAELCTTLLNKMRSTPRSDYRNRFFFVPTQSCQLLNDTATALSPRTMKVNG